MQFFVLMTSSQPWKITCQFHQYQQQWHIWCNPTGKQLGSCIHYAVGRHSLYAAENRQIFSWHSCHMVKCCCFSRLV